MHNVKLTSGDLYLKEGGWLNIPSIYKLDAWLFVIIGKRQVGKTYGVLREFLRHDTEFLYLRRTAKELELIENNDNLNPFLPLEQEGFKVTLQKNGKYDYRIGDYEVDENGKRTVTRIRGSAYNLLTMAEMRGFSGGRYKDIVLDEFIPINMIPTRKAEGDAILDIYTTVNGNRELKGEKPCRLWLLANSNNIKNPTLEALDLVPIIERLIRSNDEYYYKNGVFVFMPDSQEVSEKRKKTALMAHLSRKGGTYYRMAQENEFAYNDLHLVQPMSIKGMSPLIAVGDLYIYIYTDILYVCKVRSHGARSFDIKPETLRRIQIEYPEIRMLYSDGHVRFESVSCMNVFESLFGIS